MTDDEGRRRHYGHFYGVDPLPDGPIGIVHGNCQAESLRVLLSALPDSPFTVRIPPVHELEAEDLPHLDALLARTTMLVSQPIRDGYRGHPVGTDEVAPRLAPGARVVRFPVIRHRGLHPYQRLVRGAGIVDPPVVPYQDTRAIARAAGMPQPVLDADAVRAIAEESFAEQLRRTEAAGSVRVDDLQRAAGTRVTNTINHPGNPVLIGLAQRIADELGLPGTVEDPGRELLRSIYAPVLPSTLAALGLEGEPRVDWTVGGEPLADEQVLTEQAAWLRTRPRILAACLTACRDDLATGGSLLSMPMRDGAALGDGSLGAPLETLHLVVGPERHGVTRHATRLAEAGGQEIVRVEDAPQTLAASTGPASMPELAERLRGRVVVVHFTDRAFGPDPASSADAFERLVAPAAGVQVVLHDLPQPSDGAGMERRAAAYRRVCDAADRIVVSSEHERRLAIALGVEPNGVGVVPLPIEKPAEEPEGGAAPAEAPTQDLLPPGRWVSTLGFAYPGKGMEEVVDTVGALGLPEIGVVNLGGAAPGHEDLLEQLAERAAAVGTRFHATGWLEDDELLAASRAVDVPVAFHRHVSASGSVNSWIAAGRRPVVATSDYMVEQHLRMPGALTLVEDEAGLGEAIRAGLDDPALTRLADPDVLWPTWAEAATLLGTLR
ncbi:Glycosyltransferase involved in cell wall bisynthesis [Kytococcus aerolatus]|uniref:Glycosyltransferase involved in cell wall bisynthesis n=1 Tax=Kytococcus aerolatus TaxID=592308 RepID=A0A212THF5_9MICO|nr:WcbI family polysaccharide biosynthesis putative acetyltransferase [Kytococcus aerolatus]SNC65405.1 Glycosyltransferase involved in cell wall bisynthesis [Kytococcus aerolatus]